MDNRGSGRGRGRGMERCSLHQEQPKRVVDENVNLVASLRSVDNAEGGSSASESKRISFRSRGRGAGRGRGNGSRRGVKEVAQVSYRGPDIRTPPPSKKLDEVVGKRDGFQNPPRMDVSSGDTQYFSAKSHKSTTGSAAPGETRVLNRIGTSGELRGNHDTDMDNRGLGGDVGRGTEARPAPQQEQSVRSVDEVYYDCSPFDSRDEHFHGLGRTLNQDTVTSLIVQAFAARLASAAKKQQGSSSEESSESDSEEEEVAPPKGFGKLVKGERWIACPYDASHSFISTRSSHMIECRLKHEKKMKDNRKEMDIGVCRFHAFHHVPLNMMKEHEAKCTKRLKLYEYLDYYLDRLRASRKVNFADVSKK